MTIDKFDYEWAESGAKTPAPSDAKIQTGWVSGAEADRAYIEYFNYLQNRAEAAINRIIKERYNSFYEEASNPQAMITTGLWDESWAVIGNSLNVMGNGPGKDYQDMKVFFNSNNEPRIIVAENDTTKFEIWDPRTLAAATDYRTSDNIHDDLPVGVTGLIQSICTDGTTVYATIIDTNAAPAEYYVQAWNISTWSVKTGWPATGRHLTPTGNAHQFYIIMANATRLAIINNATTVTAAGDPVIEIIDIDDGSILADGAGDAPT
jgi:hypothetical protein